MNYKGFITTLIDRPLCQADHNANIDTLNGTVTTIPLDGVNYDSDLMYDAVNDRIKVNKSGKYLIFCQMSWFSSSVGQRRFYLYHNTTFITAHYAPVSAGNQYQKIQSIIEMVADDYVEIKCWQTSGGNLKVVNDTTNVSVYKMAEI